MHKIFEIRNVFNFLFDPERGSQFSTLLEEKFSEGDYFYQPYLAEQ